MNKFIVGLLLGIAIAGGLAYYLNNAPSQFVSKTANTTVNGITASSGPVILAPGTKFQEAASANVSNKAADSKNSSESKPSYDFYDILQGKKAADNNDDTPKDSVTKFYIQVGAFTSQNLANDMKARLALMGIDAKIKAQQDENKIINRVIVGPYTDEDDAKSIMDKLTNDNIKATLIRISN